MYLIGRAWYCGLLGQSFMIDSLNYFSFQLVLHNSCGMYKSRLWDFTYKRSLPVNQNRATFRPTKFKTYYIAQKFYFQRTVEIAQNFLHGLWLNPTGHSKHLKPIPVGLLILPCTCQCRRSPLTSPLSFPVPDRGTGEGWYLCPWQACTTTACSECAR